MENINFESLTTSTSLSACLSLAVVYVGSLYIWTSNLPRDHPQTIKERIVRVTFICGLSVVVLYAVSDTASSSATMNATLWQWMGLRQGSILSSATIPLALFIVLFMGPLYMSILEEGLDEFHPTRWKKYFYDLRSWRNYFVAPFSEELVFRGCMLPMLLPVFGATKSILLAPSFFGVAHIHHAWERYYKDQYPLKTVVITTLFQAGYTTLFGALSSWVFLRTGHLTSAVICHSFCNWMGFPDFASALSHEHKKKICFAFIFGLIMFFILAKPMTSPLMYGNYIYGNVLQ